MRPHTRPVRRIRPVAPRVSAPHEPHEREADRAAGLLMRTPAAPALPDRVDHPRPRPRGGPGLGLRSGEPLGPTVRRAFEPRLGVDLSEVRLHTDAEAADQAAAFQARAFTTGRDVVFGAGQYRPGTEAGDRLLAHELVHVAQHAAGPGLRRGGLRPAAPVPAGVHRLEWGEGEVPPMTRGEFHTSVVVAFRDLLPGPPSAEAVARLLAPATGSASMIAVLDDAVRRSTGQRHSQQLAAVNATAEALRRAFVLDPDTSSIDLLAPDRRARYRDFAWTHEDYPGGEPAGPNEDRARGLSTDLSALRPERRANAGAEAVVTRAEHTRAVRNFITGHLQPIPAFPANTLASAPAQPNGHRLLDTARDAFVQMRDAALADGVALVVLSSYRAPAVAQANAAAAGNAAAVASFSSHSLGLAVDLQMSFAYQNAAGTTVNESFAEMTTRPMQNVVDMRESPAHKWLFVRGAEFGWFPYQNEPWHWEYNPDGFRAAFYERVAQAAP